MSANSAEFRISGFQGTVELKDWRKDPISGRQYKAVMGRVSILSAEAATGLDVTNRESNWLARIEGESTSYNFPGCQVGSVIDHPGVFAPHEAASDTVLVAR